MTNRRKFFKQMVVVSIASNIPSVLFSMPFENIGELSSNWLDLVSPGSLGMDSEILREIDSLIEEAIGNYIRKKKKSHWTHYSIWLRQQRWPLQQQRWLL